MEIGQEIVLEPVRNFSVRICDAPLEPLPAGSNLAKLTGTQVEKKDVISAEEPGPDDEEVTNCSEKADLNLHSDDSAPFFECVADTQIADRSKDSGRAHTFLGRGTDRVDRRAPSTK